MFSCLVCVFLGLFVYFQSAKRLLHKLFLAECQVYAFASFVQFMMMQSSDPEMASFWTKGLSLIFISYPLLLHFALVFTGREKVFHKWWIWAVLYVPALLLVATGLFTDLVFTGVDKTMWGFALAFWPSSLMMKTIFFPWGLGLSLVTIVLIVSYYFRPHDPKVKKQIKYVAFGIISPFFWAFIHTLISELTHIRLPDSTALGSVSLAALIAFAIWRYDLFTLNPATAANNIISTMSDPMILTSASGRIAWINQSVINVLGFPEEDIIRKPVTEFMGGEAIRGVFGEAETANTASRLEASLTSKDGTIIPISVATSTLKEKDGHIAGHVLIVRDITEQKRAEAERQALIEELQKASNNIITLKGLVPICSGCKKIRNDEGYWQQVEEYIKEHTEADFSHGICSDCAKRLYPELFLEEEGRDADE